MIGYRVWELATENRTEFRLASWAVKVMWKPEMYAICFGSLRARAKEHLREQRHQCGLYSFSRIEALIEEMRIQERGREGLLIYGAIYNYGTVLVHENGYRSSDAIIDAIFEINWPCLIRGCRNKATHIVMATPESGMFILWAMTNFPGGEKTGVASLCAKHAEEPFWRERVWWGRGAIIDLEEVQIQLARYYRTFIVRAPVALQSLGR